MPKVILAPHAGFCFGVKRAITLAERSASKNEEVLTYGPLIHNPQEVERLERIGIKKCEDDSILGPNIKLIIRSHGISPQKEKALKQNVKELIDATCPFVKAVHQAVSILAKEGYFIVLLGEKNHPEVLGTVGYIEEFNGKYIIVESDTELENFDLPDKVGIVSQTTQKEKVLEKIVSYVLKKAKEVRVFNTICGATQERQDDVYNLASNVDVMVIIGGKNSGNTTRLYEISKSLNKNSYHIENVNEIQREWFDGANTVGITAGASTPEWIIKEVKEFIESL